MLLNVVSWFILWQDEKGNLELDNVRSSVDYEQCLFFSLGCRPRFSGAVASPLDARLRKRTPPSLNHKKKIDCSQSRILSMFCIQNMQKVLKVKTFSVNVKSSFVFVRPLYFQQPLFIRPPLWRIFELVVNNQVKCFWNKNLTRAKEVNWCLLLFCDFRVYGRLKTEFLLLKSWNAVAESFHIIVHNVYVPELRYKMLMTNSLWRSRVRL